MWTVIGHENAVSLLRRSLEKGSVAHAYLLEGPPHVGKMTMAIDLAKALNCEQPDKPCGKCVSCQRIADGKHADIQVIELEQGTESGESPGKTRISVEQIDQILHSVNLPPFEGKYKIFIFDGFEFLSIGAANRMLKTLEEPAARIIFILLTANIGMVPATIVSRCQRIELFPLPIAEVETALIDRWQVEPVKAKLLARLSSGCPGWAVTMAQNESLLQRRAEWLDAWLEMLSADYDQRFTFAARITERYTQNRETVHQKLILLQDWWRDLLLVKVGNGEAITNVDREDTLKQLAAGYTLAQIRHFIGSVQSAEEQLQLNVNPQLVMEVLMLSIPESGKVKV